MAGRRVGQGGREEPRGPSRGATPWTPPPGYCPAQHQARSQPVDCLGLAPGLGMQVSSLRQQPPTLPLGQGLREEQTCSGQSPV